MKGNTDSVIIRDYGEENMSYGVKPTDLDLILVFPLNIAGNGGQVIFSFSALLSSSLKWE